MSKRLQVVLSDEQHREIRAVAEQRGQSIAEWVRAILRVASRREPRGARDQTLAAIRAAFGHAFPTADIDEMLAQIESGYGGADS